MPLIDKVADIATRAGKRVVAPTDEQSQSLADKQANIDEYKASLLPRIQNAEEPKPLIASPRDRVNPQAKYGARAGEQRIDVSDMTKPLGALPRINLEDGDHQLIVAKRGERVLTPDQNETYEAQHPNARKEPMQANVYDEGGSVPMYPVAGTTGERLVQDLKGLGKRLGNADFSNVHNSADEPMLESVNMDQMPLYDRGGNVRLPRISVYDDGGTVDSDNDHRMLIDGKPIERGDASMEQRPAEQSQERPTMRNPYGEDDAKRSLIRDDIEQAQKKGDLLGMGKGLLNERIINRGDASLEARPQLPRVAGTEPTAPSADTGIPKVSMPAVSASPDLIQTKPEIPAYIGQQRIGKGTPGEAELKNERETKIDHLKYVMANGSREESADAQEQLARYEKGTPWGSPSNHPGLLGKIGHIASEVGQAALIPTAPYMLNAIPGTQARLAGQEAQGIGKIKEIQAEDLSKAETGLKTAQTKALGTDAKTRAALLGKGYVEQTDAQGNVTLQQIPGFRDTPKGMQEQYSAAWQDALDRNVDPNTDPKVQQVVKGIQATQKPEKTDDKEGFVNQYLKDNKLPDTAANKEKALAAYAKANQAPERTPHALMVGPYGNVIDVTPGMTISGGTTKLGADAAHFHDPVEALNPATGKYEVMERGQVPKGAFAYKIDPTLVNSNAARMDDVQNKINNLAEVVNSTDMKNVNQALVGAALDKGTQLNFEGLHLDTGRLNAVLSAENIARMNEPTRNFIVALLGAHEAVTNLPGLQTFGKSNRFTEKQMEASQAMLPSAGDDANMARKKIIAFQGILDPLRRRIVTLPNQPLMPSFTEGLHKEESTPNLSDKAQELLKKHGGQ